MLHHVEGLHLGWWCQQNAISDKDRRLESCAVGGWSAQAFVFSACTGDL